MSLSEIMAAAFNFSIPWQVRCSVQHLAKIKFNFEDNLRNA